MNTELLIAAVMIILAGLGLAVAYLTLEQQIKGVREQSQSNTDQIKAMNRQNELLEQQLDLDKADLSITNVAFNIDGGQGSELVFSVINSGKRETSIEEVWLLFSTGEKLVVHSRADSPKMVNADGGRVDFQVYVYRHPQLFETDEVVEIVARETGGQQHTKEVPKEIREDVPHRMRTR